MSNNNVDGKVVVITGASSWLAEATAPASVINVYDISRVHQGLGLGTFGS